MVGWVAAEPELLWRGTRARRSGGLLRQRAGGGGRRPDERPDLATGGAVWRSQSAEGGVPSPLRLNRRRSSGRMAGWVVGRAGAASAGHEGGWTSRRGVRLVECRGVQAARERAGTSG